jgi:Fe-S-cluster containining protein
LAPNYLALLSTLDDWFARGTAAAGPGVVPCARGCNACCHGPFDVSPADAALIAEGVAALPETQRAALRSRAEKQLRRYTELVPTWRAPYEVDALDEAAFDALTEKLATAPCPALAEDGSCAIHAHRPATCRLTGLSLCTRAGDVLENFCPIQDQFPAYASLAATPFDLQAFEADAARFDVQAAAAGHASTTVAGAIVLFSQPRTAP